MAVVFSKLLTSTDVHNRLAIPTKKLKAFQIPEGEHSKLIDLIDRNGRLWRVTCSTRVEGYKKPIFQEGWTDLAREKGIMVGDKITIFFIEQDGGQESVFRIQAQRKGVMLGGEMHWTGGFSRDSVILPPEESWIEVEDLEMNIGN